VPEKRIIGMWLLGCVETMWFRLDCEAVGSLFQVNFFEIGRLAALLTQPDSLPLAYNSVMLSAMPAHDPGTRPLTKVYCDTDTLFYNISRHKEEPNAQRELVALEQLLQRRQACTLTMFRSRVDLRELEDTKDLVQRGKLLLDYGSLEQIPNDEKHYASYEQTDQYGGSIANPLVSDVQDESLCRELLQRGLERRDAEHITQALCNSCDVFLTRDEGTIIRPHREWLGTRFPNLKIRLPSELLADLS
jgi:hypothetical protein